MPYCMNKLIDDSISADWRNTDYHACSVPIAAPSRVGGHKKGTSNFAREKRAHTDQ